MADQFLSPSLRIARTRFRNIVSAATSRGLYDGTLQAATLGGSRIGCSLEFVPMQNTSNYAERSALMSRILSLDGPVNPLWISDPSYTPRGSFPTSELLTNPYFANGTTDWASNNGTISTISSTDQVLRVRRIANGGVSPTVLAAETTGVLYAPYVARAHVRAGRGALRYDLRIRDTSDGTIYATTAQSLTTGGLVTCAGVPFDTDIRLGVVDRSTGKKAGDYMDVTYASLSRCALVDNAPNYLLRADEFDNASWTKTRSTITANIDLGPDGNATDRIIEDSTATSTHFVEQTFTVSSAAADFGFAVAMKTLSRSWAALQLVEDTGSTVLTSYFNLTTGAVGTTVTGANWANLRATTKDMGDGWFYCSLIGRKTNAATAMRARIFIGSADATSTYTGDGSSGIRVYGATVGAVSVPSRLSITTSAAASTGTLQTGNGLYIRGLPVSTNGLLLFGDWVELVHPLGSSLHMVTAPLDSDGAGMGFLSIAPNIRQSPIDGAAVVIHKPMGRFACVSDSPEWLNDPGVFTTASLEFEEV
jgi:hypothetical protein